MNRFVFRAILLFFFLLGSEVDISAQTTDITGVINNYSAVIAFPACGNKLEVADATAFSPGDVVIIIQMRGAFIDQTNTAAFGDITAINNAGKWERAIIAGISVNELTFTKDLVNGYTVGGNVQVVRVPQYVNARVFPGTVTAQPWNGSTGGVVALECSGNLDFANGIVASGAGFAGATYSESLPNSCSFGSTQLDFFYANPNWRGGPKGQGIAAIVVGKEWGKGKQANGGGGGNDHNSGGGGGANYAAGGLGGRNNEPGAFNCKGFHPGVGGLALSANYPTRLFMGGGGGSGHGNNNLGTSGSNGGGIIYIKANQINGNNQYIEAKGINVAAISSNDGAGGGGAGGVVIFDVASFGATNLSVDVTGGIGGTASNIGNRCYGPGGGGGGGVVIKTGAAALPGIIIANVNGGNSGITTGGTNPTCPGTTCSATAGGAGTVLTAATIPQGTIDPAGGCLLDVGFESFAAWPEADRVKVSWVTAYEVNNDYFEVQRSQNGLDFESFDFEPGQGNSRNQVAYSSEDNNPWLGHSFYRIKQVDFNGQVGFSDVVEINFNEPQKILRKVFPNPVKANHSLFIDLILTGEKNIQLAVFDLNGKQITQYAASLGMGNHRIEISLNDLAPGLYFIKTQNGEVQKFVVGQ